MQDTVTGFGFPLNEEALLTVNKLRAERGRAPLKSTPGVRFLEYGAKKDGWWNWEMFSEQLLDYIDAFDALFPNCQLLMKLIGLQAIPSLGRVL